MSEKAPLVVFRCACNKVFDVHVPPLTNLEKLKVSCIRPGCTTDVRFDPRRQPDFVEAPARQRARG